MLCGLLPATMLSPVKSEKLSSCFPVIALMAYTWLFSPWNHSVGPYTPAPKVAVENHSLPSWSCSGTGPVASPEVWLTTSGDRNVQRTSPLATLNAIVSSNCVVAKAVPLTIMIAIPMSPPKLDRDDREVGTVGRG